MMLLTKNQHKDIAESHGLPKPEADGSESLNWGREQVETYPAV